MTTIVMPFNAPRQSGLGASVCLNISFDFVFNDKKQAIKSKPLY